MEKVLYEAKGGFYPILPVYPVVLVGSLVEGKPDFSTVAWTGVAASVPPTITVALQHHRYSLKGIRKEMTFSVNIPSAEIVKETDYCGMTSGIDTDKAKDCHFEVFFGKLPSVPYIKECTINHACEVVQIINLGSHELVVGKIVETYVSQDCLTDGAVDIQKFRPLTFASRGYYALGGRLEDAFKCGRTVNLSGNIQVNRPPSSK
jgi:flavin reductase (DIM6/NTAB) family NADH-FMN oxidoreductase RutF